MLAEEVTEIHTLLLSEGDSVILDLSIKLTESSNGREKRKDIEKDIDTERWKLLKIKINNQEKFIVQKLFNLRKENIRAVQSCS